MIQRLTLKTWAVCEIAPIPLNRALFEETAICSGVWNHSGCYRLHSFNNAPQYQVYNQCTLKG